MINPDLLLLLTSDSAPGGAAKYTGMDDPTLLASINTPILTPVTSAVTIRTLGSAWGAVASGNLLQALEDLIADGQAEGASPQAIALGAEAKTSLAVINGPGLIPTDPQAQTTASQFVAAGLATQAQVNQVFCTTSYVVGDGTIPLQDVTDTRAEMARLAAVAAQNNAYFTLAETSQQLVAAWMNGVVNPAQAAGTDPSTLQSFAAFVVAQQGGN